MIQQEKQEKKPMILGIGGSGGAMLEQLSFLPGIEAYTLALIDTDRNSVSRTAAQCSITASADWGTTSGSGCGGDVIRGERAIARERSAIARMLEKHPF